MVDYSANIIFGANINESLQEEIEITVIATGFNIKPTDEQVGAPHKNVSPLIKPEVATLKKEPVPEQRLSQETTLNKDDFARVVPEAVKPAEYEEDVGEPEKKELPSFMKKLFGKK